MQYINLTSNEALKNITQKLKNVFLTGPPGSGKSYLTNKYIEYWKNKYMNVVVTASTGIASKIINGTTIHSWSGIGIVNEYDEFDTILKKVIDNKKKVKEWKKTDILIIDEISLINTKILDMLNYIGKHIRKNDSPFGGIKIFIVGDFYQLPPVEGEYCFKYEEWENIFECGINLTENHRSSDNKLNKILNKIRKGKELNEKYNHILESRISEEEHYPMLVPLRSMARKINTDKLKENKNKEYKYIAKYIYDTNKDFLKDMINRNSPLEEELVLKIGSPVINLVNDHSRRILNGMVGIIIDFTSDGPIVRFEKKNYLIEKHIWEKQIEKNKSIMMEQYPLLLAYGITIHRSQGQTLSQVSMILDNNVWEKGQGYVALSRLQSLNGLHLLKYSPNIFKVDNCVKKYYKKWKL
jgi:ATP-dependent exoDNAse (exonuclease V) alpha subunit